MQQGGEEQPTGEVGKLGAGDVEREPRRAACDRFSVLPARGVNMNDPAALISPAKRPQQVIYERRGKQQERKWPSSGPCPPTRMTAAVSSFRRKFKFSPVQTGCRNLTCEIMFFFLSSF